MRVATITLAKREANKRQSVRKGAARWFHGNFLTSHESYGIRGCRGFRHIEITLLSSIRQSRHEFQWRPIGTSSLRVGHNDEWIFFAETWIALCVSRVALVNEKHYVSFIFSSPLTISNKRRRHCNLPYEFLRLIIGLLACLFPILHAIFQEFFFFAKWHI